MARLLVLDDDLAIHDLLKVFFDELGYEVDAFTTYSEATKFLSKEGSRIDLIISDLRLPDGTGLQMMPLLRELRLDTPLILITAHGSNEIGANALKRGIYDYVTKPLNLTELEVVVKRALKLRELERSVSDYRNSMQSSDKRYHGLIGQSPKMRELFERIEKIAGTNSNILITGESGTGKELAARAIHERSKRADHQFVAINCSAIPAELLESEFFGYKKGSFTGAIEDHIGMFEACDGGTVFLDEIGDMPALLQAKLLRVLQERTVRRVGENIDRKIDVRIIAATHKDLKNAILEGEFREDLYFRLCVIPLSLVPLRERKEDIPLLASAFLRKFALLNEKAVSGFTREAMSELTSSLWQGNVRELENIIERAVALATTRWIDIADLNLEPMPDGDNGNGGGAIGRMDKIFSRFLTLKQLEKEYIHHVLNTTGGKKEDVAAILGIDRKTLYRKEREYGLNDASRGHGGAT